MEDEKSLIGHFLGLHIKTNVLLHPIYLHFIDIHIYCTNGEEKQEGEKATNYIVKIELSNFRVLLKYNISLRICINKFLLN